MGQRLRLNEGYVLVTVLLALAVLSLIGASALSRASTAQRTVARAVEHERALYAANAGVEHALAYLVGNGIPTRVTTLTGALESGAVTYSVTLEPGTSLIRIASGGAAGASVRTVHASVSLSSGQGMQVYRNTLYSGSGLSVDGDIAVCGDLFSNGSMSLTNGASVTKMGTALKAGPWRGNCPAPATGTAVSADRVIAGTAEIEGGWCDSATPHQGPCQGTAPAPAPAPKPDWEWLKQNATHLYMVNCTGFTNCTGVSPGVPVVVSGTVPAGESRLIYAETHVVIPSLVVNHKLTVAAAGNIYFHGDTMWGTACTAEDPCSAAYIAKEGIGVEAPNVRIRGALIALGAEGVHLHNHTMITGTVIANQVVSDPNGLDNPHGGGYGPGSNAVIIHDNPHYTAPPPGLPGATEPDRLSLTSWTEVQ